MINGRLPHVRAGPMIAKRAMPDFLSIPYRRSMFGIALTVPLLWLLSLGFLSHQAVESVRKASERVNEVIMMKATVAQLLLAMVDNEAGQCGYIISQKAEFLAPYNRSLKAIPGLQNTLRLKINDPGSDEILEAMNHAIDARLTFAAASVSLQTSGKHEESIGLVAGGSGKALMDQARLMIAKLDQRFNDLLRDEESNLRSVVFWNERFCWLIVVLDCVFAMFLVNLFLRYRRTERLLRVFAWSKTVEYKGEWITFEQYLARRFGLDITHGINPAEAEKLLSGQHEAHDE